MDRLHEIKGRYGLFGPGPEVLPGERFLATTTFQQKGLRARLLCDVAADNYELASAEKGARFAALAIEGTADYLRDFLWIWGYVIGLKCLLLGCIFLSRGFLEWREHRNREPLLVDSRPVERIPPLGPTRSLRV